MFKYIYMAGLLDGEGTIGLSYNNNKIYRSPYISITSTTPEIIHWLKENFGGNVSNQKVYQKHHLPSQLWRAVSWETLSEIITNCSPYMLEPKKVRRGKLILSEYKVLTRRNGKYSDKEKLLKLDFEERFFNL